MIYKRLIKFIDKNKILNDNQFGFRSKHSTSHAALLIIDKIQMAIEKGLYSCGIFLDLSKAFDTVDHDILIKKLHYYGIRGIPRDWFASYLNNRKQYVSVGGIASELLDVNCGVPQGSVLGPLLFLLYINDFSMCTGMLDFHLFADDSNIFSSNKSLQALELLINDKLKIISNWLCCNRLSFNIDKTNFVVFHPRQKKSNYCINLSINGKCIKEVNTVRYLGFYLDANLNWKSHIHHVAGKVKRSIGTLFKIRKFVTPKILLQLYYSLIYPYLTYGLILWGNTYVTNLNPLVTLQKRVVRIITFSHYDAHTSPLFKELSIIKLLDLIPLHNSLFMYDYFNNNLSPVFNDFFKSVSTVHSYNTRLSSKNNYYLPPVRTNYGKFNLRYLGVKTWLSIDNEIKAFSKSRFKKHIISSIISTY